MQRLLEVSIYEGSCVWTLELNHSSLDKRAFNLGSLIIKKHLPQTTTKSQTRLKGHYGKNDLSITSFSNIVEEKHFAYKFIQVKFNFKGIDNPS